jgi:hypothetical protein
MVSFHRTKHTHHASVGRKADVIVAALLEAVAICVTDIRVLFRFNLGT